MLHPAGHTIRADALFTIVNRQKCNDSPLKVNRNTVQLHYSQVAGYADFTFRPDKKCRLIVERQGCSRTKNYRVASSSRIPSYGAGKPRRRKNASVKMTLLTTAHSAQPCPRH